VPTAEAQKNSEPLASNYRKDMYENQSCGFTAEELSCLAVSG
jgi:hypothetical protein